MKKIAPLVLILAAVAGTVVAVISRQVSHPYDRVSYPYVCRECGAVFDVSELKKDYPRNWRIPKDAPSDSVVICLRCNKGWAYPVGECEQCGTAYILHMTHDNRCPRCFPAAAKAAEEAGVDVIFKRP